MDDALFTGLFKLMYLNNAAFMMALGLHGYEAGCPDLVNALDECPPLPERTRLYAFDRGLIIADADARVKARGYDEDIYELQAFLLFRYGWKYVSPVLGNRTLYFRVHVSDLERHILPRSIHWMRTKEEILARGGTLPSGH